MKKLLIHIHIVLGISFLLFTVSCTKQAPTVNPADITQNVTPSSPGYYYPEVVSVYPANGSTGNSVNTKYVIVFNIPINTTTLSGNISVTSSSQGVLSEGTHYNIGTGPSPVTIVTIAFIGAMNPIPDNDIITITIGAGIRDIAQNVNLNNPGIRSFQVGSAADTTPPAAILGSRTPAPGANNISRTAPVISIQFSETIDVSTLNNSTFYLETGGQKIPATIGYVGVTASLTPSETLAKNTTYTVHVTTGIKDLAGNPLSAATSWNFTTENTEIDPLFGVPTISSALRVDAVTTSTAYLSWATNEATNYTLIWGRNNDATGNTVQDLATYTSLHSINIGLPDPGKRYYAQVSAYQDITGFNGAAGAIVEFNAITNEVPGTLIGGVGNQHTVKAIPNKWGVASPGAFVFWTDQSSGSRHLYGQRFDNSGNKQWGVGGTALSNNAGTNYYYLNASEDETGGFIVCYSIGGSGVYTKRFDINGSILNWGASSDQTTDPGITIDAAGTNPSAVPVYSNTIAIRTHGTATHGSMGLPNWFFEDDVDLFALGIVDGDIVYNTVTQTGTTIDINTVAPDLRHIIGQDSVQAVPKNLAQNYVIADGITNTATFIAQNHTMNVAPNYINGTNRIYTPHGYTPPAWLNAGDIVKLGANYKRITAINLITVLPPIQTGTARSRLVNNLVDADADFTAAPSVSIGDLVYNVITKIFTAVINLITNIITLNFDAFTSGTEGYQIYDNTPSPMQLIVSGNADADTIDHLVDSTKNFISSRVSVGDIVRNNTTGLYAKITNVTASDLTLEWDAFPNGNEPYTIYDNTITSIVSGNANSGFSNHLIDSSADFIAAGVNTGDLVINSNTGFYATVVEVTKYVLELDWNAFPNGNEAYVVYDNTPPMTSLATGSADSYGNKQLIDSSADFITANVSSGDLVRNNATGMYAVITGVSATVLDIDWDAFPNGNESYTVFDNTPQMTTITSGNANSAFANHLIDATADFISAGVFVGDEVRNNSTMNYATITEVTKYVLTLNSNIFTLGNEPYTIFDNTSEMTKIRDAAAGARWADRLFDVQGTFTAGVTAGDLVINTTDTTSAFVSAIPDTRTIELSSDIFDNGNEDYAIYHNYCITHTSVAPFYEIELDGNLNANDNDTITLYDYKDITQTSDIPPANPLYDDSANFIASGVVNNDIALNITTKSLANVTTATYTPTTRALDLNANIFTDGDVYSIMNFNITNTNSSHIITFGTATSYTVNHLIDSTNGFGTVQIGDVAVNLTDNTYAMITTVAANNLTLTRDIFDNGNERYLIYRHRGVLYVWQAAGPLVRGRILNIESGAAPVDLRPPWNIANGSNPIAIPDGMGNALVVYNNTAVPSQVVVRKLNGVGNDVWGPVEIDTDNALAETIHIVQSDNAGGVIVLYSIGGGLRVQRIDTNGARQWTNNGQAIGNPAAITHVDMAYVGGDNVIVVANISGDIWACRVGTPPPNWAGYISNPTGTQQNPKIFLNGADTIITWEDDRFKSSAGWGIFGIKINASTGVRDPGWYAASNNADLNGVAFVLNNYNEYWPNILLVPINNGSEALLFWEDYRTPFQGQNIFYKEITSFLP